MLDHIDSVRVESLLQHYAAELRGGEISFRVHYWGINRRHYSNHLHKHSFFEACYVIDGKGRYEDDGESFPLTGGMLFLSRPGIQHQILSDSGLYLLFAAYEPDLNHTSAEAAERYERLTGSERFILHDAHEHASALMWRTLIGQAALPTVMPELLNSLAHCLMMSLYTAHMSTDWHMPPPLPSRRSSAVLVGQAEHYIKDNLSKALQLDEVAGYFHMSGRHLSRLLQKEKGVNFVQYVRRERVRQAALLLRHTDRTIQQIADEVGFESVHYFTRAFTATIGVSPGRYRKG